MQILLGKPGYKEALRNMSRMEMLIIKQREAAIGCALVTGV